MSTEKALTRRAGRSQGEEQFWIETDRILVLHPTRSNQDERHIAGIAASMKGGNQNQAARVYYHDKHKAYALIFGHTRFEGAKRNGEPLLCTLEPAKE